MASPTTRVLAVLELLQANGQIGGAELAERRSCHCQRTSEARASDACEFKKMGARYQ